MTEPALLRDLNKARIAFDGAHEVATGHWGCGAFGNNHDLMFLKQWMAASEAGVQKLHYHEHSKKQSHNIFPLIRKLRHLSVGQLWQFLRELTGDLESHNVAAFSIRMQDIAVGRIKVPGEGSAAPAATIERPPLPNQQPQAAANTREGTNQASDRKTVDVDSLEGKVVSYKDEEMRCIKEVNDGRLRLQRADGSTTWVKKGDVTLK